MTGSNTKYRGLKRRLYQLFLLLLGVTIMLPLLYAVNISLMRPEEILTRELRFFPAQLTYWENYRIVFEQTNVLRFMLNSLIVALGSCIVRLIVASFAAFAFVFYDFRGKNFLFSLVILSLIIPEEVLLFQNYFTTADLGLINTYLGMMVIFFISGMNVFVLRQAFKTFPREIYHASRIDGCSDFQFFRIILIPANIPTLVAVFISSFVGVWNAYLWPLLVTNVDSMRTAQVAVTMLNVNEGNSYGPGAVMAAAVVILLPSILVFLFFLPRIMGGFLSGAVKG
jgi:sn-glycerol 3-phosphate transport system permease protein